MTNKEKIKIALSYFEELFPDAKCELNYTSDYELAIAVLLSAQTTDKSVNKVTSILFSKYKTLSSLSLAREEDIASIIHSIGMYKIKAQHISLLAKDLINKYDGKLPMDKKDLISLPGIGNKSSEVIRAEIFHIPSLAVDTHVLRVSKRLGLVKKKATPLDCELVLKKIINQDQWIISHHRFIHFGRYFCQSRNPNCDKCHIKNICKFTSKI